MPKWKDSYGLPDILLNAFKFDEYTRGVCPVLGKADFSISDLGSPVQQVQLTRIHWDDIELEVIDQFARVFGSAVHKVIEQAGGQGDSEQRMFMELGGAVISGCPDYYDHGKVHDWKTCKQWAIKDGPKDEWEAQLNGYAMLLRENGKPVESLTAWAFLKDWTKSDRHKPDHPQPHPGRPFVLPLWNQDRALAYWSKRVAAHLEGEQRIDLGDGLPNCTADERWERGENWAACKRDAKKNKDGSTAAKKKEDSPAKIEEWLARQSDRSTFFIEHRPGVAIRCADWCDAAQFCKQYAKGV